MNMRARFGLGAIFSITTLLGISVSPALASLVVYEGFTTSNGYVYDDSLMSERGVCAHRGGNATYPENTLAAFENAVSLGAQQVELDVQFTLDGYMVLMHDSTVNRTTNGTGAVADLTLAQIKALDAGGGQQVPTLTEVLEILPQNIWINIDIKGDATLAAAAALEVERQNRTHQAFLACSTDEIDAARAAVPAIRICNMNRLDFGTEYVTDTIERQCDFIQLKNQLVTAADMARLKAADVRVNYYSGADVSTSSELATLYAAGVDFPLVNNVGTMVTAAAAMGIDPLVPSYTVPDSPISPDTYSYTADMTIRGVERNRVGFDGPWVAGGNFQTYVDVYARNEGLSYTGLETSPGAIELFRTDSDTTKTKSVERRLLYHYESTDDVWASFLFKYDGFDASPEAGSASNLEVTLEGANSQNFTLTIDANGAGTIQAGGSAGSTIHLGTLAAGTTHMLVVKAQDIAANQYDNLSIWLDPSDLTNLGTADHTGTGIFREQFAVDEINAFSNFRIQAMMNPTGYSAVIDELRIGTSLDADVTAEATGAVQKLGVDLGRITDTDKQDIYNFWAENPDTVIPWDAISDTEQSMSFDEFGGHTVSFCEGNGSGTIDARNRNDVSGAHGNLLEDAFKDANGLQMTIEGLEAGRYTITTYHHDNNNDNDFRGSLDIFVTDADTIDRQVVDELIQTFGSSDDNFASATFSFISNGTDDILIRFLNGDLAGTDETEAWLNGYVLEYIGKLMGDVNGDGVVDGSDATILANYWQYGVGDPNPDATWEMGDFNGDHVVDGSDATILANYWQYGISPAAAVPEPSSILLLLSACSILPFLLRRNRTRR